MTLCRARASGSTLTCSSRRGASSSARTRARTCSRSRASVSTRRASATTTSFTWSARWCGCVFSCVPRFAVASPACWHSRYQLCVPRVAVAAPFVSGVSIDAPTRLLHGLPREHPPEPEPHSPAPNPKHHRPPQSQPPNLPQTRSTTLRNLSHNVA
eukprot:6823365-Prymnesium_polylepis.1